MSLLSQAQWKGQFSSRHIGPNEQEIHKMLCTLGYSSLSALLTEVVPANIRLQKPWDIGASLSEEEALNRLSEMAKKNRGFKSYLGLGYYNTHTPAPIQRHILENPGWYTPYTPYQAEIAQGRLESLLNFQTMVADLTGLPVANASLLDEATAAAEAMALSHGVKNPDGSKAFFISQECHPQTIAVVKGRAEAWGLATIVGDYRTFRFESAVFGVLLPYPAEAGGVYDYRQFIAKAQAQGALVCMVADILSLGLLVPPGELGADIAVGNTQRFGVPLGYGGPHAAYFATKDDYKRRLPGRIVGLSKDSQGRPALRLALQTREQHIRREKATSNICTAQALLANVASMYAVYHGYEGLKRIAERVHALAAILATGLEKLGYKLREGTFFDTVAVKVDQKQQASIAAAAQVQHTNLRFQDGEVVVALDETTTPEEVRKLWQIFAGDAGKKLDFTNIGQGCSERIPQALKRTSRFLQHPNFKNYRTETKLLRYIKRLESRDLSLTASMIPLGSCTMKLNAASELLPISWPEFSQLHPFVPSEQAQGYAELCADLENMLAKVTGFDAVSLQPNSGAQGELAGLLVIKAYHQDRQQGHRNICLIPTSAHGTNPASASLAGYHVIAVRCDPTGNIDQEDLLAKVQKHKDHLAVMMITYPSTHGVFEEGVKDICALVHQHGGLVYLDGANLNAQLGLCTPRGLGADVTHINLHKTFAIPHGGGGPGMGPIAVTSKLAPYLPKHPLIPTGGEKGIKAVSAAPWGSAGILPISWMYMRMMGTQGLQQATAVAILNANFIACKLAPHYPILYRGAKGLVAHECIIDLRPLKQSTGVEVVDVAKRLMDYGFHSPTMAFPVPGTLMIEPTESESLDELERFCEAMISIRQEIAAIEKGDIALELSPLRHAPHTSSVLSQDSWDRPYTREQAAFPAAYLQEFKFWPAVGRIDEAYGDRNFFCSCPPWEKP